MGALKRYLHYYLMWRRPKLSFSFNTELFQFMMCQYGGHFEKSVINHHTKKLLIVNTYMGHSTEMVESG